MTKTWSKSVRTAQNNNKRESSSSSRRETMRVQSAMPHKQRFKNDSQLEEVECENINEDYSMVHPGATKNKSYFNDQTTCITHSQSYFSSHPVEKSRLENSNNTTLHQHISNNMSQNVGGNNMSIQEMEEEGW